MRTEERKHPWQAFLDKTENELGKFGSTADEFGVAKTAREDRFKARGDLAQLMARNDQTQRDPYVNLRFAVEIDHVKVALFSECSALTIETETFEYPEGGVNSYTHKLPTRTKYGNITLKRGLDDTQELYDWYLLNVSGKTKRRNLSIILYDLFGSKSRRWDLMGAYPCKMDRAGPARGHWRGRRGDRGVRPLGADPQRRSKGRQSANVVGTSAPRPATLGAR